MRNQPEGPQLQFHFRVLVAHSSDIACTQTGDSLSISHLQGSNWTLSLSHSGHVHPNSDNQLSVKLVHLDKLVRPDIASYHPLTNIDHETILREKSKVVFQLYPCPHLGGVYVLCWLGIWNPFKTHQIPYVSHPNYSPILCTLVILGLSWFHPHGRLIQAAGRNQLLVFGARRPHLAAKDPWRS